MKINKIYILLLLLISTFSCTDLEEEPMSVLAPDGFFQSPDDVQLAINGAIGKIASENYWGRKYFLTILLRGDMMDIANFGTASRRVQVNEFQDDAFNGMVAAFWPMSYSIICTVNSAIEGADIIDADEAKRNELSAEARFIRAFIYFNLVRCFGDIPYIGEEVTEPESLNTLSKTTEEEVYQNIIDDLEFSKEYLPMEHPSNVRSRPSRGSAYTMLADVHLNLGNWQEAYDNAKWVIDNAQNLNYGLVGDYLDLWDAMQQDGMIEHIFAVEFVSNISSYPVNVDYIGGVTGLKSDQYSGWNVTAPSLDVFETWDDRDYRKEAVMEDSTYLEGVLIPYTEYEIPRPFTSKYWKNNGDADGSGNLSDNNYAVYRYAEVLLIAAEALNEVSGPTTEAQSYINQVRARARNWAGTLTDYPADVETGLNKDEFRELVLEERRIELCFEGRRWWDIKRRDMGDEVFKGVNSLEPHDNFNSNKYLFALPQDELDRNPNLLPQNAGY